jgi:hypothetical protein
MSSVKAAALFFLVASCLFAPGQDGRVHSRLDLSLQQRLDTPQTVVSLPVTIRDFVGFIGNSFKVPLLVETTSPVPDLTIPAGTFTARQLLDVGVRQLPEYEWKEEGGVAHLNNRGLAKSPGNLLNAQIHRYYFPNNVADFIFEFPTCIHSAIRSQGCMGALEGIKTPGLDKEPLPYLEAFKDVSARQILLRALQANGHFYVLIAYESTHPKSTSDFPFRNWFTQSLVPADPAPMWIQRPQTAR